MIVESRRAEFMRLIDQRVGQALEEMVPIARRNLGGSGGGGELTSTVDAIRTGPFRGVIGSPHPGAYAQEVGAFVRPVGRRALKFADGGFSMRARIPAKRWLRRTGAQWGRVMAANLKARR